MMFPVKVTDMRC